MTGPETTAPPPNRIVVFGATGYAGGLAVEALVRRGLRPVVAARSERRLAAFAAQHGGLDYRVADVSDADSVRALVGSGDVLVTGVGPFERVGWVAAEAAARAGAHYVDSTGEVGFVRELYRRYDAQARENGSVMLPAFGYDYVPGVLAGSLALAEAGAAGRSVDIGHIQDVRVFNGWFPELARAAQAMSLVATSVARTAVGKRALDAVASRLVGPPGGPDEAERARTRSLAVAIVRSAAGDVLSHVEVEGPSPYSVTAELMAMAADRLARGLGRAPGVVGPIDGLGAAEFPEVCAEVGLTRVR
jgi:short subunit dehydrogenase-like uncharacterized protein